MKKSYDDILEEAAGDNPVSPVMPSEQPSYSLGTQMQQYKEINPFQSPEEQNNVLTRQTEKNSTKGKLP